MILKGKLPSPTRTQTTENNKTMIEENTMTLTGNLVANPETHTGKEDAETFTTARLIHSDSYKDRESGVWKQTEPFGLDLTIQGKYGEAFAEAAKKGSLVYVTGKLAANNWEDENGKHYGFRLKVTRWQIQNPSKKSTATKRASKKTTNRKSKA